MTVCCYCDHEISCAQCGREQPDDSAADVGSDDLRRWQEVVEQAMACIRGETPEDVQFGEAEDATYSRLREIGAEIGSKLAAFSAAKG